MAKKYTVYDTDTSTAKATGRPWPTADGVSQPVGMPGNLVLLEEINGADPAFDPATHKLGGWGARVYDTNAGTATRTREIVALTAEEIAAAARTVSRDAMAAQWKTQVPANIRPHYEHLYRVVNSFLDEGDDAAAVLIVEEADPIQAIANNAQRLAAFNQVKAQFVAAIQTL